MGRRINVETGGSRAACRRTSDRLRAELAHPVRLETWPRQMRWTELTLTPVVFASSWRWVQWVASTGDRRASGRHLGHPVAERLGCGRAASCSRRRPSAVFHEPHSVCISWARLFQQFHEFLSSSLSEKLNHLLFMWRAAWPLIFARAIRPSFVRNSECERRSTRQHAASSPCRCGLFLPSA